MSDKADASIGLSPASLAPTPSTANTFKAKAFDSIVAADVIDIDRLKEYAWGGIPDVHRSQAWQHLLGYLPLDASLRAASLKRKRSEYKHLTNAFFAGDHSTRTHEEREMIRQIRADVPRTNPTLPFFQDPRVRKCLERLLITWASRFLATSYVQGMNDLVAVLLLVFLKDHAKPLGGDIISDEVIWMVEADCYWCFTNLIQRVQDRFTPKQIGLHDTINTLENVLKKADRELWRHFQETSVHMLHVATRWMICFLARELPLNATVRLWDTYFSDEDGFEGLHVYVCATLLHRERSELLLMNHDELLRRFSQGGLVLSRLDVEEILAEAHIWKSTLDESELLDPGNKEISDECYEQKQVVVESALPEIMTLIDYM